MSAIYHSEPPTSGKVIIYTSYGDIQIELWAKEAPLACRNFIQLSLEGYYDNSPIHRIINGFMIQMGDPTGTGHGGESVWGKSFKDEFHGRLKFNHRGQVAMANANAPHTNKSQFFITLGACEWLNKKHTIFGKVTGATMFNVVKMGELEVKNGSDCPISPVNILRVEVPLNPFDDIVPRAVVEELKVENRNTNQYPKANKKSIEPKLLSFADQEDEEERGLSGYCMIGRIQSRHDSKFKNTKMSSEVALTVRDTSTTTKTLNALGSVQDHAILKNREEESASFKKSGEDFVHSSEALEAMMTQTDKRDLLAQKSKEILTIRHEILQSRSIINKNVGAAHTHALNLDFEKETSIVEQMKQKYIARKRPRSNREEETFEKLKSFTKNLRASRSKDSSATYSQISEEISDIGHVREGGMRGNHDELKDWCTGKLSFGKHIDEQDCAHI